MSGYVDGFSISHTGEPVWGSYCEPTAVTMLRSRLLIQLTGLTGFGANQCDH